MESPLIDILDNMRIKIVLMSGPIWKAYAESTGGFRWSLAGKIFNSAPNLSRIVLAELGKFNENENTTL